MPLLLSFDTATPHLAVVLGEEGKPVAWREDPGAGRSHAEKLNVFIGQVLSDAGRSLRDLDAVAVGTGPGSYTGLRIGLSAAKGLCFALDLPLIGMGTLDILLAQGMAENRPLAPGATFLPMVDARRMEVYTQPFSAEGHPAGDMAPRILDGAWCGEALRKGPVQVFGDGADKAVDLWRRFPGIGHWPGVRPGVKGLARCAHRLHTEGRFADLAYLVPEYGKPANVAQKRGQQS